MIFTAIPADMGEMGLDHSLAREGSIRARSPNPTLGRGLLPMNLEFHVWKKDSVNGTTAVAGLFVEQRDDGFGMPDKRVDLRGELEILGFRGVTEVRRLVCGGCFSPEFFGFFNLSLAHDHR